MVKKAIVTSEPDADAALGSWLYLRAHNFSFSDIHWIFVPAGGRDDGSASNTIETVHIDTGGKFDGICEFDHHQESPEVARECAATLVWQSFYKHFAGDQVIKDMVEFVRCGDHGNTVDGVYKLEGQFAPLMRALTVGLISLRSVISNEERMRWGLQTIDGYYVGTRLVRGLLHEINKGGRLRIVPTPMGQILFGETDRGRKELRNFVNQNLHEKVSVIVARYGDNSVGVTLFGQHQIDLLKAEMIVREEYPKARTFCHQNRFVLYVYPQEGKKDTAPTPDELFDIVIHVFKKKMKGY